LEKRPPSLENPVREAIPAKKKKDRRRVVEEVWVLHAGQKGDHVSPGDKAWEKKGSPKGMSGRQKERGPPPRPPADKCRGKKSSLNTGKAAAKELELEERKAP